MHLLQVLLCPSTQWLPMLQEENILRKKFFNQMEDMKGKIRVFARVRPMLTFEQQKGQTDVLKIPDELTLEHVWKDKKREFSFDAVFAPETSQDKVRGFWDTMRALKVRDISSLMQCSCLSGSCGPS